MCRCANGVPKAIQPPIIHGSQSKEGRGVQTGRSAESFIPMVLIRRRIVVVEAVLSIFQISSRAPWPSHFVPKQ